MTNFFHVGNEDSIIGFTLSLVKSVSADARFTRPYGYSVGSLMVVAIHKSQVHQHYKDAANIQPIYLPPEKKVFGTSVCAAAVLLVDFCLDSWH